METKYWYSKNLRLKVEKLDEPEDGKLFKVTHYSDGTPFANAGMLIKSLGGVDAFWGGCISLEVMKKSIERYAFSLTKEYQQMKAERQAAKEAERAAKFKADFEELKSKAYPIPSTYENIGIVLRYLNSINWGGWELPAMTISYSANQYDCDGKTASTMILDKPINIHGEKEGDEFYNEDDNFSKFVVGAPAGHLMKYHRA